MIQMIAVCLPVFGITCVGLTEETPPSIILPGNVAQANADSEAPPDAPLIEAFNQKVKFQSKDERVRAQVYLSVDKLPAGSTCQVIVVMKIEKGWHVNTEQPLIPLKITCNSKNKLELVDLEYPTGKPFRFNGAAANVLVHDGEIQIRGTVKIPKDTEGLTEDMELTVRYQACDEFGSLPPKNIKLIGKLSIAKRGEIVQPINGKLFNREIN